MTNNWYRSKVVQVTPELIQHFNKQVGSKKGRCTEKDVDKWLETELCKQFYRNDVSQAVVEPAPKDDDIKKDVDCLVNNYKIQVKCRKKNRVLYLEKYKTRGGKKVPGWTLRSKADRYLFVFPKAELSLEGLDIPAAFIKQLMTEVEHVENDPLKTHKTEVLQKWNLLDFRKHEDVVDVKSGDGAGCYYEVILA